VLDPHFSLTAAAGAGRRAVLPLPRRQALTAAVSGGDEQEEPVLHCCRSTRLAEPVDPLRPLFPTVHKTGAIGARAMSGDAIAEMIQRRAAAGFTPPSRRRAAGGRVERPRRGTGGRVAVSRTLWGDPPDPAPSTSTAGHGGGWYARWVFGHLWVGLLCACADRVGLWRIGGARWIRHQVGVFAG